MYSAKPAGGNQGSAPLLQASRSGRGAVAALLGVYLDKLPTSDACALAAGELSAGHGDARCTEMRCAATIRAASHLPAELWLRDVLASPPCAFCTALASIIDERCELQSPPPAPFPPTWAPITSRARALFAASAASASSPGAHPPGAWVLLPSRLHEQRSRPCFAADLGRRPERSSPKECCPGLLVGVRPPSGSRAASPRNPNLAGPLQNLSQGATSNAANTAKPCESTSSGRKTLLQSLVGDWRDEYDWVAGFFFSIIGLQFVVCIILIITLVCMINRPAMHFKAPKRSKKVRPGIKYDTPCPAACFAIHTLMRRHSCFPLQAPKLEVGNPEDVEYCSFFQTLEKNLAGTSADADADDAVAAADAHADAPGDHLSVGMLQHFGSTLVLSGLHTLATSKHTAVSKEYGVK